MRYRIAINVVGLSFIGFVQRFPARKPGLNVVPVFNPLLAELPAQIDESFLPYVWKIAKALTRVLEQDSHFVDLMNQRHQMRYCFDVLYAGPAVPVEWRGVPRFLDFRIQLTNVIPLFHDICKQRP